MMKLSLRYSKFLVRYSAVQRGGNSDEINLDCFSPEFCILTPESCLGRVAHGGDRVYMIKYGLCIK